MPQAKRPVKKSLSKNIKCPRCASRSYVKAETLGLLDRIRFIGCTVWVCGKCGKKWGG